MSLSNALSSIYKTNPQPNPEQEDQQDGMEMVSPDSQPNLDNTESCGCPGSSLAKSFVQWIADNSDKINQILDELENDAPQDEFSDDSSDFEYSQQDDGFSDPVDPQKKFDEYEEVLPTQDPQDQTAPNQSMRGIPPEDLGDAEVSDENENGYVRYVPNAHLIYKRKTEDGTFEELWFYNIGDDASRSDEQIKKDILAGTDIDPKRLSSEDGSQQYTIWTVGNGQIVQITGLSN